MHCLTLNSKCQGLSTTLTRCAHARASLFTPVYRLFHTPVALHVDAVGPETARKRLAVRSNSFAYSRVKIQEKRKRNPCVSLLADTNGC